MRIVLRDHLVPGTGLFQNEFLRKWPTCAVGQLCPLLIRGYRSNCGRTGRGWDCWG
jgi:hypothetical protein